MLRVPVNLSAVAYDVLWRHARLGDHHVALTVDSPGATHDERDRIVRDVFGQLQQVGVAVNGQPHPDVRDALGLLARPDIECYGWIAFGPERTLPVVVAANATEAVLAVHEDNVLWLYPVSPTSPAEILVAQLPKVQAASGESINVLEDEFTEVVQEPGAGFSERANPRQNPQVLALRAMLGQPRAGSAKLYAARRDGQGVRRRIQDVVTTIDTRTGRWLVTRLRDDLGRRWVHATPATPELIADKLRPHTVSLASY